MITITATCTEVEAKNRNDFIDRRAIRGLHRRDATVLMEGASDRYHQRPNVLYKKVAKMNYGPPKPKFGPPPKKTRKQPNTTRNKPPKYRTNLSNKRSKKGRFPGIPKSSKRPLQKPVYAQKNVIPLQSPKMHRHSTSTNAYSEQTYTDYRPQRPAEDFKNFKDFQASSNAFYKPGSKEFLNSNPGFREPGFVQTGQGYGEPPVDSYGAPITPNLHDLTNYPIFSNEDQEVFSSNNFPQKQSFSNPSKPDQPIFEDASPDEEMALHSYSDVFNYKQRKEHNNKKSQNVKFKNQWNGPSVKLAEKEVIVGGQYAEPPARYVPQFQPSAPMFMDESEFAPLGQLSDPELVASASTSPYVNYKHSNMAFSPQNLNDVFSVN